MATFPTFTTKKKMTQGEFSPTLDPGLPGLIERTLGSPLDTCQLVTSLLGPSPRRAYRVVLRDGRVIKVRQVRSEEKAATIAEILRQLNNPHFPQLLAHQGATLLLQWLRGKVLNSLPENEALFAGAGRLLAEIHTTPFVGKADPEDLLEQILPKMLQDTEKLHGWELLDKAESRQLARQLQEGCPVPHNHLALLHGDFCGENLVLQGETIYSVDNEALAIGFPEADIARALLRWDLSGEAEAAFLTGYQSRRALDSFKATRRFWQQVSLIRSVRFRYRCPAADPAPFLHKLKQSLQEPPA